MLTHKYYNYSKYQKSHQSTDRFFNPFFSSPFMYSSDKGPAGTWIFLLLLFSNFNLFTRFDLWDISINLDSLSNSLSWDFYFLSVSPLSFLILIFGFIGGSLSRLPRVSWFLSLIEDVFLMCMVSAFEWSYTVRYLEVFCSERSKIDEFFLVEILSFGLMYSFYFFASSSS